ncbi:carbon-nitrogen hydrolase family protein [Micromonospora sp. WMMD980]|nr:carbon-nitrogen hydrolase family protein [Micromonospora sp. WMMD980]MDG4803172.1 carbon-nitrogen hydrolase family protein [Micromonospora sp. WMMD980]
MGAYRKTHLTSGESIFAPGDTYPVFEHANVRFGTNICYDTQFPHAAAAVAGGGAELLLMPAQNMMRRDKALWWQERHNQIRIRRAREPGLWLASADVTGERDEFRVGLGPTRVINPTCQVVAHVLTGTTSMAIAEITHRHRSHGPSGRTHPAAHRVRSKETGPFFIGSAIRSGLSAYRSSCTASGAPDAQRSRREISGTLRRRLGRRPAVPIPDE